MTRADVRHRMRRRRPGLYRGARRCPRAARNGAYLYWRWRVERALRDSTCRGWPFDPDRSKKTASTITPHTMQSDEERMLSNLHVLAAVSHNDKLMTKDDVGTSTSRRPCGGRCACGTRSRDHNVERIRCTVRAAIAFATKSLEEIQTLEHTPSSVFDPRPRLDRMMQWPARRCSCSTTAWWTLQNSLTGLENLLTTYRDDAAVSSRISLVQEIKDFLRHREDGAAARLGLLVAGTLQAAPAPSSRPPSPLSIEPAAPPSAGEIRGS